jgi:hypothetical protein
MYKDKRIISVTPAGRKRYLKMLVPYLLRERGLIDKHIFWVNTAVQEDIDYIHSLCEAFPDFFEYRNAGHAPFSSLTIHKFFPECVDPNTLYFRMDDDVCWLDKDCMRQWVEARYNDRLSFVVYANIVNNAICSHLHARFGAMHLWNGMPRYACLCDLGWNSPEYAHEVHKNLMDKMEKGELDDYKFAGGWLIKPGETRVSINAISWRGETFAKFDGVIAADEELDIAVIRPRNMKLPTKIAGKSLLCHFAFFTQRKYLEEQTDILQRYTKLAENVMKEQGLTLPE